MDAGDIRPPELEESLSESQIDTRRLNLQIRILEWCDIEVTVGQPLANIAVGEYHGLGLVPTVNETMGQRVGTARRIFRAAGEGSMREPTPRLFPRLILGVGISLGFGLLGHLVISKPDMLGVNLRTYILAAEALTGPADLYSVAPTGFPSLRWMYPPLVAVTFIPAAALDGFLPIGLFHGTVLLAAGVLLGGTIVLIVESRVGELSWIDRLLVIGFATISPHAAPSLYYGNINHLLVLCVGAAILSLEGWQEERTGFFLAIPAVVKVFPAAFGLWLVTRRSWRGVLTGILTGVVAAGVSLLAFGLALHQTYLEEALFPRNGADLFVGGLAVEAQYVTLWRPLSHLFPEAPELLAPLSVLILLPILGIIVVQADLHSTTGSLIVLHAVVVSVLLAMPSYAVYVAYSVPTLVALLYLLPRGLGRSCFVTGAAIATVPLSVDVLSDVLGSGPPMAILETFLTFTTPQLVGLLLTLFGVAIAAGRPVLHRGEVS